MIVCVKGVGIYNKMTSELVVVLSTRTSSGSTLHYTISVGCCPGLLRDNFDPSAFYFGDILR